LPRRACMAGLVAVVAAAAGVGAGRPGDGVSATRAKPVLSLTPAASSVLWRRLAGGFG
jgi:hypothetical protein